MAKTEIRVKYIAEWNNASARMMVLETINGSRTFPVIIADSEALCLIRELEHVVLRRPQTHDLLEQLVNACHVQLTEVYIYKLVEGIFYTRIECESSDSHFSLESRASDAVILSLKCGCPIYVEEEILNRVGIDSDLLENKDSDESVQEESYEDKSLSELEQMLEDAVASEDFELATFLRDEIKHRKAD